MQILRNDGSKGDNGWGADRIPDKDPRLTVGDQKMVLSPRNANTMWMLHFLSHLKDGGAAGFVMATGELSNSEAARTDVRKTLVEQDQVDCIVQLTNQLFANTQIPCSLWFLSKNRKGGNGYRKRTGEILFIDARKLGALIPGSRKQKQLSSQEIDQLARVYEEFKRKKSAEPIQGFCKVASIADVRSHAYILTAGRYVGTGSSSEDEGSFEERWPVLRETLKSQLDVADSLAGRLRSVVALLDGAKSA